MTPELAIAILEGLKDHINDDGKRELSAVQKAIESWRPSMELSEIPKQVPIPELIPEKPLKRTNIVKKPVKTKKK